MDNIEDLCKCKHLVSLLFDTYDVPSNDKTMKFWYAFILGSKKFGAALVFCVYSTHWCTARLPIACKAGIVFPKKSKCSRLVHFSVFCFWR